MWGQVCISDLEEASMVKGEAHHRSICCLICLAQEVVETTEAGVTLHVLWKADVPELPQDLRARSSVVSHRDANFARVFSLGTLPMKPLIRKTIRGPL